MLPLRVKTHFSLLSGLSKSSQIATRCKQLNYKSCVITDDHSISGVIEFTKAMKGAGIKPIYGSEILLEDNSTVILLAKNIAGWRNLIKLISQSNVKEHPTASLSLLQKYCDSNMICIGGISNAHHMYEIVGKDNFFLDVYIPLNVKRDVDQIRNYAKEHSLRCVATTNSKYASQEDAVDHRILLCASLKTTLPQIRKNLISGVGSEHDQYFKFDNFHIPSEDEIRNNGNTDEEIDNTNLIDSMCENFDIRNRPKLPEFPCPNNMSEAEYLRQLCREGWKKRYKGWDHKIYGDRVKHELTVISEANLEGYFLIVSDYVNYAKSQGWLVGPGRGSGAGALTSYLLSITDLDPIPHNLLFERFYNAGRNTKDRVSYPDIDVDFPVKKRELVIDYIRNKYGHERVCHIATFGRLLGASALKEVLRANDACPSREMDEITKNVPEEFAIEDKMEEEDETSIIRWTLKNDPKLISDWCVMEDDGSLKGEYAKYFEQAIRLEGTFRNRGKHASGIIISNDILKDTCPMVWDERSEQQLAAMDMNDLEELGFVKFDILGLLALDRLMGVRDLLKYGRIIND